MQQYSTDGVACDAEVVVTPARRGRRREVRWPFLVLSVRSVPREHSASEDSLAAGTVRRHRPCPFAGHYLVVGDVAGTRRPAVGPEVVVTLARRAVADGVETAIHLVFVTAGIDMTTDYLK